MYNLRNFLWIVKRVYAQYCAHFEKHCFSNYVFIKMLVFKNINVLKIVIYSQHLKISVEIKYITLNTEYNTESNSNNITFNYKAFVFHLDPIIN